MTEDLAAVMADIESYADDAGVEPGDEYVTGRVYGRTVHLYPSESASSGTPVDAICGRTASFGPFRRWRVGDDTALLASEDGGANRCRECARIARAEFRSMTD